MDEGVPIKPGVVELLDFLASRDLPRAVASSAQRATIENHLGKAGLLPRFTTYAGRDDVALPKPAPDVYLEAARRLGIRPERCVAFEDSSIGLAAAHAAGMKAFIVPDILRPTPEAKAIAGGTALLILIKHGVYIPELLVNLRKIRGMAEITPVLDGGVRIGALATINDIERSPLVRERLPMLADACHVVANIRIRNLATIGGNLSHGDYQSDPPTALVALGAVVELVSAEGRREVALADFLRGAYETAPEIGRAHV